MTGHLPSGALGHAATTVFLSVMAGYRSNVRDVSRSSNRAVSTTYVHLCNLRNAGLVTWEDGRQGTLRPLVRAVPFGDAA